MNSPDSREFKPIRLTEVKYEYEPPIRNGPEDVKGNVKFGVHVGIKERNITLFKA